MTEWQPIKTCDHDFALVARVEKRVHKTTGSMPNLARQGLKSIDWDTYESVRDGKWTDIDGGPLGFRPTHWMPLPDPPQ